MDGSPEPVGQALSAPAYSKVWPKRLEMSEHGPEEIFCHGGVALLVGMGEGVATGRRSPPDGRQRTAVERQCVADIVEANSMANLRED